MLCPLSLPRLPERSENAFFAVAARLMSDIGHLPRLCSARGLRIGTPRQSMASAHSLNLVSEPVQAAPSPSLRERGARECDAQARQFGDGRNHRRTSSDAALQPCKSATGKSDHFSPDPSDTSFSEELGRRLAIAEQIHTKSHYYKVAREFGRLVGSANHGACKHHTLRLSALSMPSACQWALLPQS